MANQEHVKLLKSGVKNWNKWRADNPDITPDLGWASLNGLNLAGANLANANLKLAFCKETDLTGVNFLNATLYGTNLESAVIQNANFENAVLEGAHMKNTDLSGSNFSGANLKLANFYNATIENADLTGCTKFSKDQLSELKSLRNSKLGENSTNHIEKDYPDLL